jgi:cell wall-associated NlpC family hydrolase
MYPNPFPAASEAARRHAEIEAPKESVGIVIDDGRGDGGGEYVPLENVSHEPERAFDISGEDDERYRGQVKAVIHSHCLAPEEFDPGEGPLIAGPSAGDMEQQATMGLPWGLVTVIDKTSHETVLWWGDSLPVAPLVSRPFVHGIFDCYSAIRDSYRRDEFGFVREYYNVPSITLPDFPRDFAWWHDRDDAGNLRVPQNLYLDNFAAAGFVPVGRDEARAGDVFLAQIRAPVVNHGGVYLGDGTWLHHPRGRLSVREPVSRWLEYVTHFLRYEGK